MKPTLNDPKYRTFNRYGQDPLGDWTATHPWRAPGNAPVRDPCGVAGGAPGSNDGAVGYPPSGHQLGDPGSKLPEIDTGTVWQSGSTVEVAWSLWANHGGGYQYRLCPADEPLTEECFQKYPLPFVGDMQKLRLGNGTELPYEATYVREGVWPKGSTWQMLPVPACAGAWSAGTCTYPQFSPPKGCDRDTCWGYLGPEAGGYFPSHVLPIMIDRVKLPDVKPGKYVLGLRWDCEQTPQIWQSCSDVTITTAGASFALSSDDTSSQTSLVATAAFGGGIVSALGVMMGWQRSRRAVSLAQAPLLA